MQRTSHAQLQAFRTALARIREGNGRNTGKIAQLESLKALLLVAVQAESKRKEMRQLEAEEKTNQTRTESTHCSSIRESVSEMGQSAAVWEEAALCRRMLQGICSSFEERHKLNSKLYELQCLNEKVSCMYQKYLRAEDYQSQAKMLRTLLCINQQVSLLHSRFLQLKHSIAIQHDNLRDVLKVMRVRYTVVKRRGRERGGRCLEGRQSGVGCLEGQKRRRESRNENGNQILVNMG